MQSKMTPKQASLSTFNSNHATLCATAAPLLLHRSSQCSNKSIKPHKYYITPILSHVSTMALHVGCACWATFQPHAGPKKHAKTLGAIVFFICLPHNNHRMMKPFFPCTMFLGRKWRIRYACHAVITMIKCPTKQTKSVSLHPFPVLRKTSSHFSPTIHMMDIIHIVDRDTTSGNRRDGRTVILDLKEPLVQPA